jgi:CHAD domain-containing protein
MTTPTTTKPASYAEHDKLGPLGVHAIAIDDPVALRGAFVRAFEAAALDARDAVVALDKGAPAAVHAARKALRRARAVLGLVGGALPRGERRAVKAALREARRALSTVRDHAVAPDTLAHLALDDEDRATANRVTAIAAEALPATTEIRQLLAEAAARAAAQAEALQAALPPELAWATISDGLRATYRAARRARRGAKRSRRWFHAWRRRSKELVYQLELIALHGGPRVAAIRDELTASSDHLGPTVDLIMVRDFVATYAQGVPPASVERLCDAVDHQLDESMAGAQKAARDAFRAGSKKLVKRVAKAIRRDLTPPDDAPAPS